MDEKKPIYAIEILNQGTGLSDEAKEAMTKQREELIAALGISPETFIRQYSLTGSLVTKNRPY